MFDSTKISLMAIYGNLMVSPECYRKVNSDKRFCPSDLINSFISSSFKYYFFHHDHMPSNPSEGFILSMERFERFSFNILGIKHDNHIFIQFGLYKTFLYFENNFKFNKYNIKRINGNLKSHGAEFYKHTGNIDETIFILDCCHVYTLKWCINRFLEEKAPINIEQVTLEQIDKVYSLILPLFDGIDFAIFFNLNDKWANPLDIKFAEYLYQGYVDMFIHSDYSTTVEIDPFSIKDLLQTHGNLLPKSLDEDDPNYEDNELLINFIVRASKAGAISMKIDSKAEVSEDEAKFLEIFNNDVSIISKSRRPEHKTLVSNLIKHFTENYKIYQSVSEETISQLSNEINEWKDILIVGDIDLIFFVLDGLCYRSYLYYINNSSHLWKNNDTFLKVLRASKSIYKLHLFAHDTNLDDKCSIFNLSIKNDEKFRERLFLEKGEIIFPISIIK